MMSPQKNKMHVRAGDLVKVVSGNHRGAQGKILRVIREKNQVIIENVRMIKKHLGRSQDRPQGEIIEREGPIHVSNVKKLGESTNEVSTNSKTVSSPKARKVKKTTGAKKEE